MTCFTPAWKLFFSFFLPSSIQLTSLYSIYAPFGTNSNSIWVCTLPFCWGASSQFTDILSFWNVRLFGVCIFPLLFEFCYFYIFMHPLAKYHLKQKMDQDLTVVSSRCRGISYHWNWWKWNQVEYFDSKITRFTCRYKTIISLVSESTWPPSIGKIEFEPCHRNI